MAKKHKMPVTASPPNWLGLPFFLPSLLLLLELLLGFGEVSPVAPLGRELEAFHLRHGPELPSCLVPEQKDVRLVFVVVSH